MTLRVFRKFGIIKIETKEQEADFEKVLELIMASKQPVQVVWPEVRPDDNLCQHVHSHEHLYEIFRLMYNPKGNLIKVGMGRGSFVDLVFRLILFHQSLPGNVIF